MKRISITPQTDRIKLTIKGGDCKSCAQTHFDYVLLITPKSSLTLASMKGSLCLLVDSVVTMRAKKGLLSFLFARELGENISCDSPSNISQIIAEEKSTIPIVNKACQLQGPSRSTFLVSFSSDRYRYEFLCTRTSVLVACSL